MRASLLAAPVLVSVVLVSAAMLPAAAQAPPGAGVFTDVSTGPDGAGLDGVLRVLAAAPDGSVYAGGQFTRVGGVPAGNIARWDGAAWRALGTGLRRTGGFGVVDDVAVGADGSLYAVGDFDEAGTVLAVDLARWDGAAWSAVGTGRPGGINEAYAVAVGADGTLYVGGRTYNGPNGEVGIVRWTGTAWSLVGAGLVGNVWALAVGPDGSVFAGGEFLRSGSGPLADVMRWDGTAWQALGAAGGQNAVVFDLAVTAGGGLVAGGYFTAMGGVPARNVARWDGAAWSALGDPSAVPSEVYEVHVAAAGRIYVGGGYSAEDRVFLQLDGTSWTALGPFAGVSPNMSVAVAALAETAAGDLFVGGQFATAGGVASPNVVRYSPAAVAAEGGPDGAALSLAVSPNPARGPVTATVTAPAGAVLVELFDGLGRRVARVEAGEAGEASGSRALALPTAGLAPGLYVVRASAGRSAVTRPLVVVK